MAVRGRKPTPTALKVLEGNPGKRKLNDREPKPKKRAPSCPQWLEPDAKAEWKRLAKKMTELGILTEVDMASFSGYCQAYARWKEAEEFLTQHGPIVKTPSGYWQQVPQVAIANKYLKIMGRFASEFGLTPSSRSRIIANTELTNVSRDGMLPALIADLRRDDDIHKEAAAADEDVAEEPAEAD